MRHAIVQFGAVLALALAAAVSVRAQSPPDAAMLKPVQQWIAAYNAGTALPEDIFTDDVVITDEFPPYVWSGKAGEHAWASAIDAFIKPGNQHVSAGAMTSFQASRGGTRARFVLPATLTFTSSRTGKRETEQALWLFVLVKSGDVWKIAADTWTTAPANVTVPVHNENGVLLVDAALDGARPLLFTFDPGAGDLYTRDARALLNGRAPKNVCLSSACFTANMQYFDADPAQLYPQHDASLGAIGGSIGPALLHSYVAEIDYRASTLTLIPPAHFAAPRGVEPLPLRSDSSGMPVVAAAVDGTTALFELDVRAPTSMLFTPFLDRTGLGRAYASTPVVKKSMFAAHAVRRVQISGVELHGVPFWFSTASNGKFAAGDVAGLLGNNVLSHFVVTLDVPHRRAYFTPDAAPSQ